MQVWTLLCFTYLTIQPRAKGKQWPVTSLGYQGGAVDKGLSLSPRTHLVKAAGYLPLLHTWQCMHNTCNVFKQKGL